MHFLFMTQDIQDQVNHEIETVIEERDLLRSPSQNYIFGGGGYGYHRKFSAQYKTIEKKYLFTTQTLRFLSLHTCLSGMSWEVVSVFPLKCYPRLPLSISIFQIWLSQFCQYSIYIPEISIYILYEEFIREKSFHNIFRP